MGGKWRSLGSLLVYLAAIPLARYAGQQQDNGWDGLAQGMLVIAGCLLASLVLGSWALLAREQPRWLAWLALGLPLASVLAVAGLIFWTRFGG